MTAHILPIRVYLAVFVALLVLLAATVAVNFIDLGEWNVVIPMTIALAKMFLVLWFFMHVRSSGRLIWIYVAVGFYWLAILLTLTLGDFLTRGWLPFAGQ